MKAPNIPVTIYLIGGAVALLGLYVFFRGARGVAADAAGAAVNVAAGVAEGTIGAVLDVSGLDLNQQACENACAAGDAAGVIRHCDMYRAYDYMMNGK